MQELEKILERGEIIAIEELEEENERCNRSCEGCCSEMEEGKCYCKDALVISAIKKLIERIELCGDGWIPVEDRLPEVDEDVEETIEDDECPEYIVTIRGGQESTTLKYSPDGTWFDDYGYVYDVIAWRPLPEPYRPERSEH